MGSFRKNINIEVGARLKQIRENKHCSQSEFAAALGIGDEHYRKLENGSTGLTIEKIHILHDVFSIDPTYLIIGTWNEEFDFDKYITNCTREQKNKLMDRILEYMKGYFSY